MMTDAEFGALEVPRLRLELEISRQRIARLLIELEAAWVAAGGRAGASIYTPNPHGPADPAGCGACRGTGIKGD